MSYREKTKKILIYVLVVLGVTVAGILYYLWNSPIDQALKLPTFMPVSVATSTIVDAQESTNLGTATTSIVPVAQDSSTPGVVATPIVTSGPSSTLLPSSSPSFSLGEAPQPLCGGPSVLTILVVGSDSRDTSYLYGLADVIRVVRIDFTIPRAIMLDFPRDLWVEVPGISDHYGIDHSKLNESYFYGNPGMGYYDGPAAGSGLLAQTLALNFGLYVDHYIAVDAEIFAKMVDAIGGLDVYLSEPLNANFEGTPPEKYDPKMMFSAGYHHLDGQQALMIAEGRIPTTFQRTENQNVVLRALRDKLMSPSVLPKLPKLFTAFRGSLQTDLTPKDISELVCLAGKIESDNEVLASFPEDWFKGSSIYDPWRKADTFVWDVDFNQMRALVTSFMNGTWPAP